MADQVPTSWAERFESLRFISNTQRAARDQRRSTQIRAFFTTLTFFALIVAAKFTGKLALPQSYRELFLFSVWALLLGVALLSSIYLEGLHRANSVNREIAHNAEAQIMSAAGISSPTKAGTILAQTRYWEIALIFMFAVATRAAVTWF
jgi:hypothetical protein